MGRGIRRGVRLCVNLSQNAKSLGRNAYRRRTPQTIVATAILAMVVSHRRHQNPSVVRPVARYHLEKVGTSRGQDAIKRALQIHNSGIIREDVYVERAVIIRIVLLVLPVKIMSVCLHAER